MGERFKLLDLYCGAGGAARGYQMAGFHVTGVDLRPMPRYAGDVFVQTDALTYLAEHGREYDAIHASPPCQAFTAYRRKGHGVGEGYPDLIGATRDALKRIGRPWVIENVIGAPLWPPRFRLCGSMFGLDVRRHRLFESPVVMDQLTCNHEAQTPRFPPATNRTNLRSTVEIGVWRIPLDVQKRAMGVDWEITRAELSQALPPAYTQWLGTRLRRALEATS